MQGTVQVKSIKEHSRVAKRKLERHTGGLEGCGSESSAEAPRYRYSEQQLGESTRS